ncbi:hypothetical protein LSH36_51g07013 [Paralvinella palmiformis]|uniref:Glycosyltransferase-like protein n=1 Tax=Paralvinella palmiformis TaxID=53620 RepID=A0AAD9K5Q6_9ANNE|nr:hypothetical protein LSH36_51g07013 [Paralvinella palmiformis]
MTHTLLLDRIGMGTNEEGAPKEAITNLTLDKCIDVIRASKTTASRLKMMNEASNKEIKRKNPLNRSKEIRIVLMNLNVLLELTLRLVSYILQHGYIRVNCDTYRHSSNIKHQVHSNVLKSTNVTDLLAVTLTTHLSVDRFDKLLDLMRTWNGPVSASVYVKDMENKTAFVDKVCSSYIKQKWSHFQLHFVKGDAVLYPVNALRNIAIKHVQTDFLFITDVDFIPMPGTHESLKSYIKARGLSKNEVFVIPAFEEPHENATDLNLFPRNKVELLMKFRNRLIIPFQFKFIVLPDVFIVHTPHSTTNADWFRAMGLYRCAEVVEKNFIQMIRKKYKFLIKKEDILN